MCWLNIDLAWNLSILNSQLIPGNSNKMSSETRNSLKIDPLIWSNAQRDKFISFIFGR